MHRNLGFLQEETFRTAYFRNGKEKLMVLLKEEIVVFILVHNNTNYWNDFAFRSAAGVADGILLNKLKKNGKLLLYLPVKVRHPKETFMKHLILLRFGNSSAVIENNGYGLSTLQMNNIVVKTLLIRVDMVWKVIL
jgi:hypothetical protein